MVMLSKSLFVTKIFCRGLDIRVTEVVMTRFDIIRLHGGRFRCIYYYLFWLKDKIVGNEYLLWYISNARNA